jgi:hypothetical protein
VSEVDRLETALDRHTMEMEQMMQRLLAEIRTNPEEMEAGHEELMAIMKTTDLETNREKSECGSEHLEVPKEEAAVETIGALVDRHGDRHLAVWHRRQPKKRTQRDGGSRHKLAAARGRLTRRAVPFLHDVKAAVI